MESRCEQIRLRVVVEHGAEFRGRDETHCDKRPKMLGVVGIEFNRIEAATARRGDASKQLKPPLVAKGLTHFSQRTQVQVLRCRQDRRDAVRPALGCRRAATLAQTRARPEGVL